MNSSLLSVLKTFAGISLLLCFLPSSHAQQLVNQRGMLSGKVVQYDGNCIPAPRAPPCKSIPVSTTIYISQQVKNFNQLFVIDSTASGSDGLFSIQLEIIGTYSVFVQDEENVICDRLACPNECHCHPIKISPNDSIFTQLTVDRAIW